MPKFQHHVDRDRVTLTIPTWLRDEATRLGAKRGYNFSELVSRQLERFVEEEKSKLSKQSQQIVQPDTSQPTAQQKQINSGLPSSRAIAPENRVVTHKGARSQTKNPNSESKAYLEKRIAFFEKNFRTHKEPLPEQVQETIDAIPDRLKRRLYELTVRSVPVKGLKNKTKKEREAYLQKMIAELEPTVDLQFKLPPETQAQIDAEPDPLERRVMELTTRASLMSDHETRLDNPDNPIWTTP